MGWGYHFCAVLDLGRYCRLDNLVWCVERWTTHKDDKYTRRFDDCCELYTLLLFSQLLLILFQPTIGIRQPSFVLVGQHLPCGVFHEGTNTKEGAANVEDDPSLAFVGA